VRNADESGVCVCVCVWAVRDADKSGAVSVSAEQVPLPRSRRKSRGTSSVDNAEGLAEGSEATPLQPPGVGERRGSWSSLLDESLRAATAPPKDERESARRRSGSEAPAWLAEGQEDEWSGAGRAALKSAQGLGLQDLNASLRQNRVPKSEARDKENKDKDRDRDRDKDKEKEKEKERKDKEDRRDRDEGPPPSPGNDVSRVPPALLPRRSRIPPSESGDSLSMEKLPLSTSSSGALSALNSAPSAPASRPQRETSKSASGERPLRSTSILTPDRATTAVSSAVESEEPSSSQVVKSPSAALRPSSREAYKETYKEAEKILQAGAAGKKKEEEKAHKEAYKDSLLHTRQLLEGKVASSAHARRPTSRPASSRQIDSSEVFPLARSPSSSAKSGLGPTAPVPGSPGGRGGGGGGGAESAEAASPDERSSVASDDSSLPSPGCVIKVFGGSEFDAPPAKGGGGGAGGVGGGVGGGVSRTASSERGTRSGERKPSATGQRGARSVSRDGRTLRGSADSHPTSTHAWQPAPEDPHNSVSMNRVHRAQRVYMGVSAEGGKAEGGGGKGVAPGFGKGPARDQSSGSRRVVSAVPRTHVEIPWLEREAAWRRRQRQAEREHSAHPQSRDGTSLRPSGPMKPSPNERAGVRSATLKGSSARATPASVPMADSDGRAVFTGAANLGADGDHDDGQGNKF